LYDGVYYVSNLGYYHYDYGDGFIEGVPLLGDAGYVHVQYEGDLDN
jgi:hypothetical protein